MILEKLLTSLEIKFNYKLFFIHAESLIPYYNSFNLDKEIKDFGQKIKQL